MSMNAKKQRILLKFTGKILGPCNDPEKDSCLGTHTLDQIVQQIKQLQNDFSFSIVIGGGNILRGENQSLNSQVSPSVGHQAGMLATIINSLIIKDVFLKNGLDAEILSSIVCPQICMTISQEAIDNAIKQDKIIIFAGGTGSPFFTTDTNAVVRALQVEAKEIFKCTNINGIYSCDPKKDKNAKLIKKIKYSEAIDQRLEIMDITAITLAQKHGIAIRVFDIFEKDSLIKAANNTEFGSLII